MVKIALQMMCRLDNIDDLKTSGSKFKWWLKFTCSNCGETTDKWNGICLDEYTPAARGSNIYHFMSKCKFCLRENSMTIIENSITPFIAENQEQYQTIVVFDCRGIEPIDFSPRTGWIVRTAENGKEFTDIDLTDGEWEDYCDKTMKPVGIYQIQYKFLKIK
jgi:hypothetical protein